MALNQAKTAKKKYLAPTVLSQPADGPQLLTATICFNNNDCAAGFECCTPGTVSCQLQGTCE
jgi:hypothetical protein